ncbi:MAG: clostripain-related cysteine peptidase, partial [bacterium]
IPEKENWIAADHAYADRKEEEEGIHVNDYAIESFEMHEIFKDIGFDIDLFNFAACHMGQVEVINDLPENIKYAMASPSFGYTADIEVHRELISHINNGNHNSKELGKIYVDEYVENLNSSEQDLPSVKALYNMNGFRAFVNSFTSLSEELYKLFDDNPDKIVNFQEDVLKSNKKIQSYFDAADGGEFPERVYEKDLLGMLSYLRENEDKYNETISSKADNLYEELDDIIVYSRYSDGVETSISTDNIEEEDKEYLTYKNSNGLSIWVEKNYGYSDTWFNQETNWNEVIEQVHIED